MALGIADTHFVHYLKKTKKIKDFRSKIKLRTEFNQIIRIKGKKTD